jgi:tRNA U55 pseudouridine synthase TruB
MYLEYKETGITMQQFINLIKDKYPHKKYAYTARLDPMARGIVPILVDDECKDIDNHFSSKKVYNVRIIIGIQTDSDDVLGLIEKIQLVDNFDDFLEKYKDKFLIENNKINQKFHYFSTKALKMRKQNKLQESYHMVELIKSNIISPGYINFNDLKDDIIKSINKIDSSKNFRQDIIIDQWNKCDFNKLPYIDLELNVSSGFFVRQFIRDLSIELNQPMLAYDIYRKVIY